MNKVEAICIGIRRGPKLRNADPLWRAIRPLYDAFIGRIGVHGLRRTINGTDPLLVHASQRLVPEQYEAPLWAALMQGIRPGNTFVDVGAYVGLYSIAVAKRVGPKGKVIAFEPDSRNFLAAAANLAVNRLDGRVQLLNLAVGARDGEVAFAGLRGPESRVGTPNDEGLQTVRCVALDSVLPDTTVDLMKIDVEGFEYEVLQGCRDLLSDPSRCPRRICLEIHPFAWPKNSNIGDGIVELLGSTRYKLTTIDGHSVTRLTEYGHVLATHTRRRWD